MHLTLSVIEKTLIAAGNDPEEFAVVKHRVIPKREGATSAPSSSKFPRSLLALAFPSDQW